MKSGATFSPPSLGGSGSVGSSIRITVPPRPDSAAAQDDLPPPHPQRLALRQVRVHPVLPRREEHDSPARRLRREDGTLDRLLVVRPAISPAPYFVTSKSGPRTSGMASSPAR